MLRSISYILKSKIWTYEHVHSHRHRSMEKYTERLTVLFFWVMTQEASYSFYIFQTVGLTFQL